MPNDNSMDIYLERGKKKVFACAVNWPGWCRSGPGDEPAINSLLAYTQRYAAIIQPAGLVFPIPKGAADFDIIEWIEGNFATDFGVPNLPIPEDYAPLSSEVVLKFMRILQAEWLAFDQAVQEAQGKQLRKGPRGGGRELEEIVEHVTGAEKGYLRSLGWTAGVTGSESQKTSLELNRNNVIRGIQVAAQGSLPAVALQRGKRWPLAYFFRRIAWHVVDHTWEIEDRIIQVAQA